MFVTLEGMEGSGKSTLLLGLAERFRAAGRSVLCTREPGGSGLGRALRPLLLDCRSSLSPEAELFLFLADRAQHAEEVLRPALERGQLVLCDRYVDSTIVYQGYGRGFDIDNLVHLNEMAIRGLWPDRTLILDLPPEEGLARARGRNARNGDALEEGRFESEALRFHTAVREGFLAWAEKNARRCQVLDAQASPEAVLDAAWKALC